MTPIPLPITTFTTLLLAAVYLLQTWSVIRERRSKGIVHGDNGDRSTQKRIRGHAATRTWSNKRPFLLSCCFWQKFSPASVQNGFGGCRFGLFWRA